MNRYAYTLALLILTLCIGLGVAIGSGAASSITAVDDDHGLTEPETIDQFDEIGVAQASVDQPMVSLTIADRAEDVELDRGLLDSDATSTYLRVQYNESIDRELRVFIPAEYWHPVSAEIDAENAEVTAEMRPTEDGRYTAVTVEFEEQTDAVFDVPKEASFVFWTRDRSRDIINETFGYEPPQLSTGGEWQYIDSGELATEQTIPIDTSQGATIQYNDRVESANESDDNWLSVPRCSRAGAAVCTYTVDGDADTTYLLTQTSDPPQVRYKAGDDPVEAGSSILRDLRSIPDRVWGDLQSLFTRGG
ncbi:hypothetical protein [Natronocalculus amylovorans]|uniref:Uncharacterized protein n=1 Tax=Natronocalculus amylovorans TaxID=2917812 RepID=A0AAE3FZA8_9EURY|nr:hypothetical protein [Natronocalculus amylovorans]MCL9818327.1 hypothetical protein [Natronocalculus amylovorans]